MFLSNVSVRRPVAMSTVILLFLFFGIMCYQRLGVNLMPQVDVPRVTIQTLYPGASPEEIETAIAQKIEDAVSSLDGVKHVTTTCLEGACVTFVEFMLSQSVDVAAADVRDRVDRIIRDLPGDAERPVVMKYDINSRPVVYLALTGKAGPDELFDYADQHIKDRFAMVPGVASVELLGGAEREVHVIADRARLAAKGLTLGDLVRTVREGQVKMPAGSLKTDTREWTVTFDAEAKTLEEIGALPLPAPPSQRIYLRDVARVEFGTDTVRSRALLGGRPCVSLRVIKKGEANAVDVVDRIRRVVGQIQPTLPRGMDLIWFHDDGEYIRATVDDGWSSVYQGMAITALVLLLFLQHFRSAVIVFISLPVSVMITFAGMKALGYTLNTPTLSAFGVSVGILVTNSIVVLENIIRRRQEQPEGDVREQVRTGTAEVGLPVFASAMTNVAVFAPMVLMTSLAGRFLTPFAMTITVATLASIFVSFTLTPILSVRLLAHTRPPPAWLRWVLSKIGVGYDRMEKKYDQMLRGAARHAWIALMGMTVISFAIGGAAMKRVRSDFTPQTDQGQLLVKIEYPVDQNLDETLRRTAKLSEIIQRDPDVLRVLTVAGKTQGLLGQVSEAPYLAEISVRLKTKTDRTRTIDEIAQALRGTMGREPGRQLAVLKPSVAGDSKSIEMEIHGPDLEELNRVGYAAAAMAAETPGAMDVEHTVRAGRPELKILPRRAVLQDMHLAAADVGRLMRGSFDGLKAATWKTGDRMYDLRVKLDPVNGIAQVDALNFPSPDGHPVRLPAWAGTQRAFTASQIIRAEKERIVKIYADAAPGAGMGTVSKGMMDKINTILPAGYTLRQAGLVETMSEAFDDFRLVMLMAIVMTYLLLAAILESWGQPLLILTTVPFSYIGLFLAIALTQTTLTILGLVSGVMLIGVVVNNAILQVDDLNILRAQGVTGAEAMLQAARRKFRPVFMTSLAAVLGMLPMAMGSGLGSELRASIGIGAVGGMLFSSLVSLFFVPLLYVVLLRVASKSE